MLHIKVLCLNHNFTLPFPTHQMLIDSCQMLMTSWHRPLRWTYTWRRWWWLRPQTPQVRLHPAMRRRIYWWLQTWNSLGKHYFWLPSCTSDRLTAVFVISWTGKTLWSNPWSLRPRLSRAPLSLCPRTLCWVGN